MSAILETSLNILNGTINRLPSPISNLIGKLPIISSIREQGIGIPATYFSGWLDLDRPHCRNHLLTIEEHLVQIGEMLNQTRKSCDAYIGVIGNGVVVLNGPVTIMPQIGTAKKIFWGVAITFANAFLVYRISHIAFQWIEKYFRKQESSEESQSIFNTTEKTIRAIAVLLGLCTAIAVGHAAYQTFILSPGIYGNRGPWSIEQRFCHLR